MASTQPAAGVDNNESKEAVAQMDQLPPEVQLQICQSLATAKERLAMSQMNRQWHRLLQTKDGWAGLTALMVCAEPVRGESGTYEPDAARLSFNLHHPAQSAESLTGFQPMSLPMLQHFWALLQPITHIHIRDHHNYFLSKQRTQPFDELRSFLAIEGVSLTELEVDTCKLNTNLNEHDLRPSYIRKMDPVVYNQCLFQLVVSLIKQSPGTLQVMRGADETMTKSLDEQYGLYNALAQCTWLKHLDATLDTDFTSHIKVGFHPGQPALKYLRSADTRLHTLQLRFGRINTDSLYWRYHALFDLWNSSEDYSQEGPIPYTSLAMSWLVVHRALIRYIGPNKAVTAVTITDLVPGTMIEQEVRAWLCLLFGWCLRLQRLTLYGLQGYGFKRTSHFVLELVGLLHMIGASTLDQRAMGDNNTPYAKLRKDRHYRRYDYDSFSLLLPREHYQGDGAAHIDFALKSRLQSDLINKGYAVREQPLPSELASRCGPVGRYRWMLSVSVRLFVVNIFGWH